MSKFEIKDFKGVIPALLTVFDENENIDEKGMRELVSYLIDLGVDGLYLTGSTGEGFTMSSEERKKVVEIVMDEVKDRIPVVVHIGAIGTKLSIELAKHAESLGVTGISSVPPFYWKFSEKQIINYYKDIAESCKTPMIVYNVPLAGLLTVDTIEKLASIENIKGIKYTAQSHYEITQIKDKFGEDFLVYSGCDEMALSGLLSGADGIIGSTYNVLPDLFININNAVNNKDIDLAKKLQKEGVSIIMYLLNTPCFLAGMKSLLRAMGIRAGYCRRPFENFNEEYEKEFLQGLKSLKEVKSIENVRCLNIDI